jgi:putative transposase
MRFALIDGAKAEFPVHRLCRVLGVSQSGYFAWRGRPACRRQRDDMVLLAHVRSAFALSKATYGSPRMTRELQDAGLVVGRRRVARLMRDNGLQARQKRRFKRTTDSNHAWPIAPNLLDQDFTATAPDKKWGADISPASPMCGPAKAGSTSPSLSTCSHAGSLAGQQATGCIATWLLPLCAKP